MKKSALIFSVRNSVVLLLLAVQVHAQDPMYSSGMPRFGFERDYMTVFAGYSAGSTMINNAFLNKFYQGGFIDAAMKQDAMKRANPYNHLGVYAEAGYAWHWRTGWGKKRNDTIYEILLYIPNRTPRRYQQHNVTYRERFLLNSGFDTDVFRLAFEGNRPFFGDTAQLAKTKFTNLRWQELHYGIDFYNDKWPVSFGVGVSVLNGQQFSQLAVNSGSIYTDPTLGFIDVAADAKWQRSDTAQTGWGTTNGLGASLSLKFGYQFQDVFKLEAEVRDLGAIGWNKNTMTYTRDTLIHFTGIDISNAVLDPESVDGFPETDSLTGLAQKGTAVTWLPVSYMMRISSVMQSHTGFQYGWTLQGWGGTKTAPQNTLWASYRFRWFFRAQAGVSIGGFSRVQLPAELALRFKHIHLQAGTPNLAAWILPKQTNGQGLWISLGYQFGNQ